MKRNRPLRAALMISAAVVLSAPAVAQQAVPAAEPVVTVTPPPVAPTASTPAATPAATPATSAGDSATPVNSEAAAQAEAEDAERAAERRDARRAAPRREAAVAAPVARAAPTRAAAPQQAASAAPAPAAAAPAAPAATTPAPSAATPTAAEPATQAPPPAAVEPAQEGGAPVWPLAVIAALIIAAGAFFFLRRRKAADEEQYWTADAEEPAYVEPVAEPVNAAPAAVDAAPLVTHHHDPVVDAPVAPVAAEEASVAHADSDDVAALTAVDAPGDRPWLEFAMRPVRAGTNVDEALVEIELTVGNAGAIAAEDVRISTFMLSADDTSEMERLLIEPHDDAAMSPLTIAAGEGTRVDATLAMNRTALAGGDFRPVIVADARYRLPDGSEGRTSASFLVGGATDSGAPEPIALDRNLMRDDVEAQLFRQPERV